MRYEKVINHSQNIMKQILKDHGIKTVKTVNGSLLAYEVSYNTITGEDYSKWVNVTNWTKSQLYFWLGY